MTTVTVRTPALDIFKSYTNEIIQVWHLIVRDLGEGEAWNQNEINNRGL